MNKHTPHNDKHQWIAVGNIVEYTNDEVADICSCNPADYGQESCAPSYEQQCANANLIAAAPDLLQALKEISKDYDRFIDSDCKGLYKKSMDAIAKAEGKSPCQTNL